MTDPRDALKLALEALEYMHDEKFDYMRRNLLGDPLQEHAARLAIPAIAAARAALAAPQGEPVAQERARIALLLKEIRAHWAKSNGEDSICISALDQIAEVIADGSYVASPPAAQVCNEAADLLDLLRELAAQSDPGEPVAWRCAPGGWFTPERQNKYSYHEGPPFGGGEPLYLRPSIPSRVKDGS